MTAVTSVDLEELVRMHSADECPIGQYNRYLIVPEGGGKPVPHVRATTVVKAMDEGFGISDWTRRLTVVGFVQNPILFARLCATDPTDNDALDKLCDEAKKAAGGEDARDKGNVLHAFSEKVDRGLPVNMPDEYRKDIDAYRARLDELEIRTPPELVERYVVLPADLLGEPIAGKCDRYAWFGSTLKAADLKTGKVGRYSWLGFAIQLAIYSRARTIYSPRTKTHEPIPDIDQDTGMIFHLPAGQARCDVYFVDLNLGWQAAQVAVTLREWRRRGNAGELAEAWRDDIAVENVDVRRVRLIERIAALREIPGGIDALLPIWPDGIATFKASTSHTPAELDLIAMAISTAEAKTRAPFGAPDPADNPAARTQEQP